MDSNYQIQKNRVNERIQSKMRAAETERMLKKNLPEPQLLHHHQLERFLEVIFNNLKKRRWFASRDSKTRKSRRPRLAE